MKNITGISIDLPENQTRFFDSCYEPVRFDLFPVSGQCWLTDESQIASVVLFIWNTNTTSSAEARQVALHKIFNPSGSSSRSRFSIEKEKVVRVDNHDMRIEFVRISWAENSYNPYGAFISFPQEALKKGIGALAVVFNVPIDNKGRRDDLEANNWADAEEILNMVSFESQ